MMVDCCPPPLQIFGLLVQAAAGMVFLELLIVLYFLVGWKSWC